FAQAMAASFGRSVRLRMPDWLLRRLAGEMATLLLDGQNAVPRAALAAGYRFAWPRLLPTLDALATSGAPADTAADAVAAPLRSTSPISSIASRLAATLARIGSR